MVVLCSHTMQNIYFNVAVLGKISVKNNFVKETYQGKYRQISTVARKHI